MSTQTDNTGKDASSLHPRLNRFSQTLTQQKSHGAAQAMRNFLFIPLFMHFLCIS